MSVEEPQPSPNPAPSPHSPAAERAPRGGPVALQFDLQAELERLQPSDREPTGRTLVKEPDLRVVLIALRAGGRMREHNTSGPISVQVLRGRVQLQAGSESYQLSQGGLLALGTDVPHEVEALEDSAFLLSIGRTRYHDVSEHHESER